MLNETLGLPPSHSTQLRRRLRGLLSARSAFLALRRLGSHKDILLHYGLTVLVRMHDLHFFLLEKFLVLFFVPGEHLLAHSEQVVALPLGFLLLLLH